MMDHGDQEGDRGHNQDDDVDDQTDYNGSRQLQFQASSIDSHKGAKMTVTSETPPSDHLGRSSLISLRKCS